MVRDRSLVRDSDEELLTLTSVCLIFYESVAHHCAHRTHTVGLYRMTPADNRPNSSVLHSALNGTQRRINPLQFILKLTLGVSFLG